MEVAPILIFIAFLCLMLVGAYFSHKAAVRRREALKTLAQEIGWRFSAEKDGQHGDRFRQFSVFQQGSSRYAYNTLSGTAESHGATCAAFMGDYHYETKSTNSKGHTTTHHHRFSYLLMELPAPGAPQLTIRPEGLFDKIGGFFGFDDIDFESAEFSREFCVKSSDKKFAYDVVHPRMMQFLLQSRGPALAIDAGYCCLSEAKCWEVEQFTAKLDWLEQFFALWPEFVIADLRSRAEPDRDTGRI